MTHQGTRSLSRQHRKPQPVPSRPQTPSPRITEGYFNGQKYIGEPRVLFLDVETSPILGYAWQKYEADIFEIVENTKLLCISYRWNHENKTKAILLPHFRGYKPGVVDDRHLMKAIWKLLDEADVVIAHNGDRFDVRKINARFFAHGMTPPRPYSTIDTLKTARKFLSLDSNKMGDICKLVGIGRKLETHGKDTWLGCIKGDPRAWRMMEDYNIHDTELLYRLYARLVEWAAWKPNRRRPIYAKG